MARTVFYIALGALLAVFVSYAYHLEDIDTLKYKVGLYDVEVQKDAIRSTLPVFNRLYAEFYGTGGDIRYLHEFPAAQLVKRRILQEIQSLALNNRVLVYDKAFFEIQNIELRSPATAVAVTKEAWYLMLQEYQNRERRSKVKTLSIQVRYLLRKRESEWRVIDYDIYGKDDSVPLYVGKALFDG